MASAETLVVGGILLLIAFAQGFIIMRGSSSDKDPISPRDNYRSQENSDPNLDVSAIEKRAEALEKNTELLKAYRRGYLELTEKYEETVEHYNTNLREIQRQIETINRFLEAREKIEDFDYEEEMKRMEERHKK
jgi:hypothetical protein